jgi:hypothetical protein
MGLAPTRGYDSRDKDKEENMTRFSKPLTALVLGVAVSALATPSYAQRSEGMSGPRAQAIRACNKEAGKLKQYVWGDAQQDMYRSCMMKDGQQE